MAEPTTRADRIDRPLPWLWHWSIRDERIGGFRSDAYAVDSPDGLLLIDALPLEPQLEREFENVGGLLLTHGNHQRSAWRLRRELGVRVFAPPGVTGLDEAPDVTIGGDTALPAGLAAVEAAGFDATRYLVYTHTDGTRVVFCGDLLCQDPGGPYRFPVQEGYFDPVGGEGDARRLLDFGATALCPAHGTPSRDGAGAALTGALERA